MMVQRKTNKNNTACVVESSYIFMTFAYINNIAYDMIFARLIAQTGLKKSCHKPEKLRARSGNETPTFCVHVGTR